MPHSKKKRAVDDGALYLSAGNASLCSGQDNSPPTIISSPNTFAAVGQLYTCPVIAEDPDGDDLDFVLQDAPEGMTVDSDGLISWTPQSTQTGTQTVVVEVSDGRGGLAQQSYDIAVPLPNNPPEITSVAPTTAFVGQVFTYTLAATDPDGDSLSYQLLDSATTAVIDQNSGVFTWTPTAKQDPQVFTVTVDDGNGGSHSQTFSVIVGNTPPLAQDISVQLFEDQGVDFSLLASDVDADTLSYVLDTQPASGVLIGTAPSLRYVPAPDINGVVQFSYHVNDGEADSNTATVTITIIPVNDRPLALDAQVTVTEDQSQTIPLNASDIETPASALNYRALTPPINGSISVTGASVLYTPNENYVGPDSFSFVANDSELDSNAATITILVEPVNDPPVITSTPITTGQENSTYSYAVTVSDVDSTIFAYTHDDNGSTLTETLDGTTKTKTYTWDGKNKLIGLDNAGSATNYTYNHNGIRTSKSEAGSTTQFIIDENRDYAQVLEEVVDNTSAVTYSYGHDLINQDRDGTFSYYHYDGLGSTRHLSDDLGSLTDSYDYEAFGEVLAETDSTENRYKYTGEQFDQSLNQYYLRARYYDQGIGRFTQIDTWQGVNVQPITLNKYLYANADPALMVDPSGNASLTSLLNGLSGTSRLLVNAVSRARSLFSSGGSSSSARGASIVLNRSAGFLKSIARKCRASGSGSNPCKYALGWSEARAKMWLLVSRTSNTTRINRKIVIVIGAFDIKRGRGTAAFNGEVRPNRALQRHARKFGSYLGEENACNTPFTTGRCAELRAARNLVRSRSRIKNIRFTQPRFVDKGAGNTSTIGRVRQKGACDICRAAGFSAVAP